MFADISGFTAWSSVREPAQVFVLLETIYQSFDKIAKQRRVFKVCLPQVMPTKLRSQAEYVVLISFFV